MGSVFGELDQFVFVVSNGPLAPVGAAQVVLPMQTLPLRFFDTQTHGEIILPPLKSDAWLTLFFSVPVSKGT